MSDTTIITLGCRLNAYESDRMAAHAASAGLDETVIVNTCAVTGEAVRQARQMVRRLKRERPNARLVVTGCAVQIEPQRWSSLPEVDHVIGNAEKMRIGTFASLRAGSAPRVMVADVQADTAFSDGASLGSMGASRQSRRARAYVQVQNGCDHRCTFCIIPYGRGQSRSRAPDAVIAEIEALVAAGVREVVLTGVDLTSYCAPSDHSGISPGAVVSLGRLVRRILSRVPDLARLRLSSFDQVEADADLLRAIAEEPRLMPHLHLSLQAGDDLVLKRMKRRHSAADAVRFCETARRLRPDIVFGADLIAGFPTENEAMFARSMAHVADCGLTYLHVFPYSPREGTPAARMPQVANETVKERAQRLRALGEARLATYLESQRGNCVLTLIERPGLGRTPQFAEVAVDLSARAGEIVEVTITGADRRRLLGERADLRRLLGECADKRHLLGQGAP